MKKLPFLMFLLLIFALTGFDYEPVYYGEYEPIFMLRPEMEKNVKTEAPKPIVNPGKIYIKDQWIFINEKFKGIHVIDNSNPEHPENKYFITIDGCIDMAIKNSTLYADNAVDLIAIRLDNGMNSIEVTTRIKDVFPEIPSPDGRDLNWREETAKPEGAILVRWEKRK
ncbi:MAG: hypothetical protein CSA36_01705 [Draconibacterium sp.]|nr:MAG: hypothetical protein CSA36_01705 [Draconibacterium sp.]